MFKNRAFFIFSIPVAFMCIVFNPAANAAVITWNYSVESTFTGATPTGPGDGFVVTPSEISWGDPLGSVAPDGGRSAISISNSPAMGSIDTNGAPGLVNIFSHSNNVVDIDEYPQLLTADIQTTATLTPTNPPDGALPPLVVDFTVRFVETLNEPDDGICPVGVPLCQDIFVIEAGALNFPFAYDGEDYFITLFEATNQLNPLPDGACAAAGAANGCIGFLTDEEAINNAQFAFVITQTPISEPQSLLLLGLGLAGLGLAAKRRTRAA